MTKRCGRPYKYAHFLNSLEDNTLYCPASIVSHGEGLGYFRGNTGDNLFLAKQRVRITLGRLSNNHDFPLGGDGLVIVKGQAPIPGWLGSRWKAALGKKRAC